MMRQRLRCRRRLLRRAPLTPVEIKSWNDALDNWNAFLVFAIKQLGLRTGDKQIHDQLFTLLIDSRYKANPGARASTEWVGSRPGAAAVP